MDSETNDNLECQIAQLLGKTQALTDCYMSLDRRHLEAIAVYEEKVTCLDARIDFLSNRISRLELESLKERLGDVKDLEELSELCAKNFKIAFNRIGRLERGERVNDLGLDE